MKKFFTSLIVVALILPGCTWFSSDGAGVKSMTFKVYDEVSDEEWIPSVVQLVVVPDYKNRTLFVTHERVFDMADGVEDADSAKNEGIVGGSHFDSFVELVNVIDGLEPLDVEGIPIISCEVLTQGESEPIVYKLGAGYGDDEAPIYEFYASLSPLFSQDVY